MSLLISLLQTPRVLLLDEISANVDPKLKHDIWDVLARYHRMVGGIIIMTSHDAYEL